MGIQDIQSLLKQIKVLSPEDKGLLLRLFFAEEKKQEGLERRSFFGSVRLDNEISDEDIKSVLFNYNLS